MNTKKRHCEIMISLSEYTQFPGGAYRIEGSFSGEDFRETFLVPALKKAIANNSRVVVDLDGTLGLSTSFTRAAFGGLVAVEHFSESMLKKILHLVGSEPETRTFIREAWAAMSIANQDILETHH